MKFEIAAALVGAVGLSGCNQSPPPLPIKELMATQVQPTAQVYWDSVRYVSDETGNHDYLPETDADWEKTRTAAVDLQRFGELLQTDAYTDGRGADWTQFAQGLIDVGKQAELAAQQQNVDGVFEVSGTIYNVCSACHQAYPAEAGEVPAATNSSEGNS